MKHLTPLILPLFYLSCLSPLNQARQEYTQALTDQHAALVQFQRWDRAHQFSLIHQAVSKIKAKEVLCAYRKERNKLQIKIAAWIKPEDQSVDVLLSLDQEAAAIQRTAQEKAQVATLKQAITLFEQQQETEASP